MTSYIFLCPFLTWTHRGCDHWITKQKKVPEAPSAPFNTVDSTTLPEVLINVSLASNSLIQYYEQCAANFNIEETDNLYVLFDIFPTGHFRC